jgi:hypothetical protein
MTIPAIPPPDIDDDLASSLADPVCTVPVVLVPAAVDVDEPDDRQERSLDPTTSKMLLLAAVLGEVLSHPAK